MILPETQQQIIEFLSKNRVGSCFELSDTIGTTPANIHHHLQILRDRGMIEPGAISKQENTTRGRPRRYYRLAGRFLQHNLEEISREALYLLKFADVMDNASTTNALAENITKNYYQEPNLTRRLRQAIHFLNQRNYRTHWEASRAGPKIIFRNCPYASILKEFPALCDMDKLIVRRLIGLECQQIAKLSLSDNSVPGCVFLLEK